MAYLLRRVGESYRNDEPQVNDLITRVIAPVVKGRSSFVEVKAGREKIYNERLHAAIGKTIFNNSCSSVSREKM